jgi:hypothetical protein
VPICVDCRRWSPRQLERCPDCSGALEPEPAWARPSRDPQLESIARLVAKWHRRSVNESLAADRRAAARTELEAARRRYDEALRSRLPELEAADNDRQARARAAGLTVREYEAKREREDRDRRWLSDPAGHGQVYAFGTAFLVLPLTCLLAPIMAGVFMLAGRSALGAVGGVAVGGLAGLALGALVFLGSGELFDRLARTPGRLRDAVRRFGEDLFGIALIAALLLPPALAVLVALLFG